MQGLATQFCVITLLTAFIWLSVALAATPAGSVIRNQASATYKTEDGVERTTTSNVVETLVRQVADLQINQGQLDFAIAGGEITFPHVITNTGNGPDSYTLTTLQLGSDDFDYVGIEIYADANHDGVADNSNPITQTQSIAAGDDFAFVVVASIPTGALADEQGKLRISAQSNFNTSVVQSNDDTAQIRDGAVITLSKSMNIQEGDSTSGPFTVTLNYRNEGTSTATDVVLIDRLPDGMVYEMNSARWSETDTLVLSDNNPLDSQGTAPNTIRFCSYRADCIGLPEAVSDADAVSDNQVTAIISEVPAGASGSLIFEVNIQANQQAVDIFNVAEFEYSDGPDLVPRSLSNQVRFRIAQTASVVANGSTASSVDGTAEPVNIVSAFQGSAVEFENIIWNIGNDSDIIDIIVDTDNSTFPPGTIYQLFREDGATPLLDSSGNNLPDTGPLASGASIKVILRATLPANAVGDNGGAGYQVSKRARSTNNPTEFNDVIDKLDTIVPSTVDLTNTAAAGTAGSLGEGIGPEGGRCAG